MTIIRYEYLPWPILTKGSFFETPCSCIAIAKIPMIVLCITITNHRARQRSLTDPSRPQVEVLGTFVHCAVTRHAFVAHHLTHCFDECSSQIMTKLHNLKAWLDDTRTGQCFLSQPQIHFWRGTVQKHPVYFSFLWIMMRWALMRCCSPQAGLAIFSSHSNRTTPATWNLKTWNKNAHNAQGTDVKFCHLLQEGVPNSRPLWMFNEARSSP